MARLQDYATVTPSPSDNLLIVQSQGQGLAQLKNIATNNLNGEITSGGTIRSVLVDTSIPKGVYFYQTRYAADNPESGTLTTTMIYKNSANGNYSRVYAFVGNSIYYCYTSSSVPSSLTWNVLANPVSENITSQVTWNEDYANARVTIRAGVVYITYQGESKAHSANTDLFVMPQGYRPLSTVFVPFVKNALAFGNVFVYANGNVRINQISDATATGRIYFSCSYPIV